MGNLVPGPDGATTRRPQTATIFVDESGSRTTGSKFFVVGAVKLRRPGLFARRLRELRDQTGFAGELKFSEINRASVPIYREIITALEASDATLHACVVHGVVHDPFKGQQESWKVYASVVAQLMSAAINRDELVGVLIDSISTPPGTSLADAVRARTNSRLKTTGVVSCVCLDSKSNDVLQVLILSLAPCCTLDECRRADPATPGRTRAGSQPISVPCSAGLVWRTAGTAVSTS